MNKQSVIVGAVIDGTPKLNRTVRNEKFYTIVVEFKGTEIPVLISEYNLREEYSDTIQVTGCVMSDFKKGELPKFYFYANAIENVDADTPLSNEIYFCGKVTKNRGFTTNARCRDILALSLSDMSPVCGVSVLYVSARDAVARKLKDRPVPYEVAGRGYLKAYRDVYEIIVTEIEEV